MPDRKLYEVLTVYALNGVAGNHIGRYIVSAPSASWAGRIALPENEEVACVKELSGYELVVMENEQ